MVSTKRDAKKAYLYFSRSIEKHVPERDITGNKLCAALRGTGFGGHTSEHVLWDIYSLDKVLGHYLEQILQDIT